MDNYTLWLDGVSNEDVGIRLQGAVEISAPVPNVETVKVPGRNGDLHFFDGAYANRTAAVGAYVYRPERVKEAFGEINHWLVGTTGYRKLTTDDDDEHFMMARVVNGAEIAVRIRRIAPFNLKFDCKPQRFLTSGEEVLEYIRGQNLVPDTNYLHAITNPTQHTAKPLYKIYGTAPCSFQIADGDLFINEMDEYIMYDAETQRAYKGDVNMNHAVRLNGSLEVPPGTSYVALISPLEKVEIVPRWWEL